MDTSQATTRRGVTLLTLVALVVIVIIALTVVAPALRRWVDPAEAARHANALRLAEARDNALEPLRLLLAQVGLGTVIIVLIALAGAALAGLVAVWQYLPVRAQATAGMVYPKNGMQPTLLQPESSRIRVYAPARNEKAEEFRAIFSGPELVGVDPPRVSSPTLRQLSAPDESVIDAKPELTPQETLEPDFSQRPHMLVVGKSGSGKTNTLYHIVTALQDHGVQFVICSLVSKDWRSLSASRPETIAEAVQAIAAEMQRRDVVMREKGAREFADAGLQPLCFVLDEAEAVIDAFEDRKSRGEFCRILRQIMRTGRNYGIIGIYGTQEARGEVFPPSVLRNIGEMFIHRIPKAVAAQFQIWDSSVMTALVDLPTGRAYVLRREAYVTFTRIAPPGVPLSDLYREPAGQYLLPADASADGLGDDDLPDGVYEPDAAPASVPEFGTRPRVTYEQATAMYLYWLAHGRSLRAVQRHFNNGSEGGDFNYDSAWAINRMLELHGQRAIYQEVRPS